LEKITLCAVQPLEKAQNGKGLLLPKVGVGLQKVGLDLSRAPHPLGLRPAWASTAERLMQAKTPIDPDGFGWAVMVP
jgi:hypothetical protein